MRATVLDLRAVSERNCSGLVELAEVCISLRVSIDKGLERAAIGASLGHVHLVVAQQNLRVNHLPAYRTDAAREFVEDVVRVLLQYRTGRSCCVARSIQSVQMASSFLQIQLYDPGGRTINWGLYM